MALDHLLSAAAAALAKRAAAAAGVRANPSAFAAAESAASPAMSEASDANHVDQRCAVSAATAGFLKFLVARREQMGIRIAKGAVRVRQSRIVGLKMVAHFRVGNVENVRGLD